MRSWSREPSASSATRATMRWSGAPRLARPRHRLLCAGRPHRRRKRLGPPRRDLSHPRRDGPLRRADLVQSRRPRSRHSPSPHPASRRRENAQRGDGQDRARSRSASSRPAHVRPARAHARPRSRRLVELSGILRAGEDPGRSPGGGVRRSGLRLHRARSARSHCRGRRRHRVPLQPCDLGRPYSRRARSLPRP